MALSKTYTAQDIEDLVRVNLNQVLPDTIQPFTIRKYINLAISQTALELNQACEPDYGETYTLTIVNNTASLSSLGIDKVIKVVDSNYGQIAPKSITEYNNLSNIDSWKRNILYSYYGETLYFFTGSLVSTPITGTLFYYRLPTPVTASTDYIDIRDKWVPTIAEKVKSYILVQIGQKDEPPTPPKTV